LSRIFLEDLTVADTLRNLLSVMELEIHCCLHASQQIRQNTLFTTGSLIFKQLPHVLCLQTIRFSSKLCGCSCRHGYQYVYNKLYIFFILFDFKGTG